MPSLGRVWALALAVRLPLALLQRTPFQPDESYQSLEPAHALVFGPAAAHLTWEWRWNPPVQALGDRWAWLGQGTLRGSAWVALWAGLFWLLQQLALDNALIVIAPKVVMAHLAAACDTATFALAERLCASSGPTALMLSLTSIFHAHALTRPFANSVETTLTTAALALWPAYGPPPTSTRAERGAWQKALAVAAVAGVLRPTNVVLWAVPGVSLLGGFVMRGRWKRAVALLWDVLWIATLVLGLSTALDTYLFPPPPTSGRRISFPPATFLAYNLLTPTASFYGASPAHYYLSQAIPVLLGLLLPFTLVAFARAALGGLGGSARELAGIVALTVGVYSAVGHKEWRFLHPLLPVLLALTAAHLSTPSTFIARASDGERTGDAGAPPPIKRAFPRKLALALALTSAPAVAYLSLYHGGAQHAALAHLRTRIPSPAADASAGLGVLMPCHSTPWQAHLHRPDLLWGTHAWFLECPPPLARPAPTAPSEEAEFYANPARWLALHLPPVPYPSPKSLRTLRRLVPGMRAWPSHLLLFGALLGGEQGEAVEALLRARGYAPDGEWEGQGWNGFDWAQDDTRRTGGVQVWRLRAREEGEGV